MAVKMVSTFIEWKARECYGGGFMNFSSGHFSWVIMPTCYLKPVSKHQSCILCNPSSSYLSLDPYLVIPLVIHCFCFEKH